MEQTRFDALTRTLSSRFSRRSTLRAAGAGIATGTLAAAGLRAATAQDSTPEATGAPVMDNSAETAEETQFLFVQTATSGSLVPNPGAGAGGSAASGEEYRLTLEGHGGGTVYFSDRPERIFGNAPTGRFLDGLGFDPGNPPNAALVTQAEDGTEDVVILELLNPDYDEAAGSVSYNAVVLAEYQGEGLAHVVDQQLDSSLPESFGQASLFIDDCADTMVTCRADYGNGASRILGTRGMCWHFGDLWCRPCGDYAAECNATFPDLCQGRCGIQLQCGMTCL